MAYSYRQLTPLLKQQIITAFQEGYECRAIPQLLGVSKRSVTRVLAEAGVNTKRRNRYELDEGYFAVIDTPTKAYLLGLMAADGCVTATNYGVYESIEASLVDLFKTELKYTGKTRIIFFEQGYAVHYRINFSSPKLAQALRQYGVFAGRMQSGDDYLRNSEYFGSYLLGYFDGDGCAYVNKGRSGGMVGIVASASWAQAVVQRLQMGKISQHCSKSVYYWQIYRRAEVQKFYDLIYQNPGLGLSYKKAKIEQILGSYRHA